MAEKPAKAPAPKGGASKQTMADTIKKEMGIEKGAANKDASAGDISLEKLVKVAQHKKADSLGKTLKDVLKEAAGTCKSIGVTIGGKSPIAVIKEIDEGKHDSLLAGK
jgi:large subunit ribosomal protein L11